MLLRQTWQKGKEKKKKQWLVFRSWPESAVRQAATVMDAQKRSGRSPCPVECDDVGANRDLGENL